MKYVYIPETFKDFDDFVLDLSNLTNFNNFFLNNKSEFEKFDLDGLLLIKCPLETLSIVEKFFPESLGVLSVKDIRDVDFSFHFKKDPDEVSALVHKKMKSRADSDRKNFYDRKIEKLINQENDNIEENDDENE